MRLDNEIFLLLKTIIIYFTDYNIHPVFGIINCHMYPDKVKKTLFAQQNAYVWMPLRHDNSILAQSALTVSSHTLQPLFGWVGKVFSFVLFQLHSYYY